MKIAVFHNALDNIGGAEIVGLTLARRLNADLYTTNVDREKIEKMGFADVKVISIGKIPLNAPFRQQEALRRFRYLNLNGKYGFYIIDGDWAMSAAVNHRPNLWYVHSPIREIWDLYGYTRQNTVPWYLRHVFDAWVYVNRFLNRSYLRHVDMLACNSQNTRNRIKNYLERDAEVAHPPIDTSKYHYQENGDFWLSVNRLITHKRVDMQLEAFRRLPEEKLVIVGSYEQSRHFRRYARFIQDNKPDNVEIRSWVNEDELVDLYARCKGFITTAQDEDFGMAAVEAMASGKPVIAPDEGGYRETVVDGQTGRLLSRIDGDKLRQAVEDIGRDSGAFREACLRRSRLFDEGVFIKKIREKIDNGTSQ